MFLICSFIEAYSNARYGVGSGRILLDDLECYGNERSVVDCRSGGWYQENCDHGEDAGVSCHGMKLQQYIISDL